MKATAIFKTCVDAIRNGELIKREGKNDKEFHFQNWFEKRVFGRYPKEPDGNRYAVTDLVLCHGSFLNADSSYVHKNKSFRGFGSYGDILVRDRKMYVAPTPFALADGTAHRCTLILPKAERTCEGFSQVGTLRHREVDTLVVAYQFDLQNNVLSTKTASNPNAGREHIFIAYRLQGDPADAVILRSRERVLQELEEIADDE